MTSLSKKIISDESNELYVFDKSSRLIIGKCPNCQKSVRMIFPTEAAVICDLSIREIFKVIETNSLHFIETDEKVLMICSESLNEFAKKKSEQK